MEVEGFEFFGEAAEGGGYDWSVFGVWMKDGQFFWADDAGCSCNDAWDHRNFPADFAGPGSVHDVIRALMAWKTYSCNWEPLLNRLLNYRV